MELSKLQQDIVNSTARDIAVVASAAAGKTAVLTERVRKMLRDGINPSDIAVITFTNLAAQELRDRLADDYKEGIYIGTIHGLANTFLTSRGIDTSALRNEQAFDKLFDLIKQYPGCVKHYKYLLLDESQDTSPKEYEFIFDMIKPESFFVVGDYRQSIYSFRSADPELFNSLVADPLVATYYLNENYRNGSNILRFAADILKRGGLVDDAIPMRRGNGKVYEGLPNYDTLKRWIKENKPFSDWAVLCNTNTDIANMIYVLSNDGIPCITFKQGEVTKEQLNELMKSDAVKVLTRHSSKGLEFPNVAVWEPAYWTTGSDSKEPYRVNYVAATRARDILLWFETPPAPKKSKRRRKYDIEEEGKWFG